MLSFFQGREMTCFLILLQVIKNEYFMIMFHTKAVDWRGWISTAYPKAEPHGRKVMLCVWWDQHGIKHFGFLEHSMQTYSLNNCNVCMKILKGLHSIGKMFLYNARPYSARITQEKILALKWSVLLHPLY